MWCLVLAIRCRGQFTPAGTRNAIDHGIAARHALYEKNRPLFPMFTRYVPYCDSLAADIGCLPSLLLSWSTLWDPRLAVAVKFGPMAPAQYRLRGPNATPAQARALLLSKL